MFISDYPVHVEDVRSNFADFAFNGSSGLGTR
jgi:hypothetical protein